MLITGSCHCNNITYVLDWEPVPDEIPARVCGCSFCRKHGGVWTSSPAGSLKVSERDPALINKYSFGTGTARFHICKRCGIVPLVTSDIDSHLYAVVNVNTFNNVESSLIRILPASFDGESVAERLARRQRNWIPRVEIIQSDF